MSFRQNEELLIAEAVRTGASEVIDQPWLDGYRRRQLNAEVKRRSANAGPQAVAPRRGYYASSRIKWRGKWAIHEDAGGVPKCGNHLDAWMDPKNADEKEFLGGGLVDCQLCGQMDR